MKCSKTDMMKQTSVNCRLLGCSRWASWYKIINPSKNILLSSSM